MSLQELTELLTESSEHYNLAKTVPWWESDQEDDDTYYYEDKVFSQDTIEEVNACVAGCQRNELLSPAGQAGLTLFHLLVWHNFYDAVEQMLLDGRVDSAVVNQGDAKGQGLTPFLLACSRGNLSMVRLLLEHGADDSLCDERGMNAYHFLSYTGL